MLLIFAISLELSFSLTCTASCTSLLVKCGYFSLIRNNKDKVRSNLKLKIANEELIIAKEKAEEASNIKTQFISNISHELRTPLYGVIGMTDIIEEEHKELRGSQHYFQYFIFTRQIESI